MIDLGNGIEAFALATLVFAAVAGSVALILSAAAIRRGIKGGGAGLIAALAVGIAILTVPAAEAIYSFTGRSGGLFPSAAVTEALFLFDGALFGGLTLATLALFLVSLVLTTRASGYSGRRDPTDDGGGEGYCVVTAENRPFMPFSPPPVTAGVAPAAEQSGEENPLLRDGLPVAAEQPFASQLSEKQPSPVEPVEFVPAGQGLGESEAPREEKGCEENAREEKTALPAGGERKGRSRPRITSDARGAFMQYLAQKTEEERRAFTETLGRVNRKRK